MATPTPDSPRLLAETLFAPPAPERQAPRGAEGQDRGLSVWMGLRVQPGCQAPAPGRGE